jgi:hypothetical protein
MMNATKTMVFGLVTTMGALLPAPAQACEYIQSVSNLEGALSLNNFAWGQPSGANRALRALPVPNGYCEGEMVITAKDAAITTDVGDAVALRKINVNDMQVQDWVSGVWGPGFITRFQIQAPQQVTQATIRSLTFREIEFSPPLNEVDPLPGHLRFVVFSNDGGNTWNISARMFYRKSGQDFEIDLGTVYASSAPQRKFEVKVETAQQYTILNATTTPRVRVTYSRPYPLSPVVWQSNLPPGMFPVRQRQGLLEQYNVTQNSNFTIAHCDVAGCASAL